MKSDANNPNKPGFLHDGHTIIINMTHPNNYWTTTPVGYTTTQRLFDCTTPIQVSGNNDVEVSSTIATTTNGETVAVVTCTVKDGNANNQQAWMNENGMGWITTPGRDQTMVRTYRCDRETGSWYSGNSPADTVRFVRCSNQNP